MAVISGACIRMSCLANFAVLIRLQSLTSEPNIDTQGLYYHGVSTMSVDQDDAESMLESMDSALSEVGDESTEPQTGEGSDSSGDSTATSALGQEEGSDNPEPWVHYIPSREFKHSDDLATRINEFFDVKEQTMLEKEFKLYDYVLKLGNVRYYQDFLAEVNDNFRNIVKLKKRKVNGQNVIKVKRNLSERHLPGFEPIEEEDFQVVTDTLAGEAPEAPEAEGVSDGVTDEVEGSADDNLEGETDATQNDSGEVNEEVQSEEPDPAST